MAVVVTTCFLVGAINVLHRDMIAGGWVGGSSRPRPRTRVTQPAPAANQIPAEPPPSPHRPPTTALPRPATTQRQATAPRTPVARAL